MDVLHEIGFDGPESACAREVAGDMALGIGSADLRVPLSLGGPRWAVHDGDGNGRLVTDVNMQIHDVVH